MEIAVDADGRYAEVAVVQTAPQAYPVLRPHRIGVGRYAARRRRPSGVEVDLDPAADGGRTALPELTGEPAAGLLLPNDGDLTFAKLRLDPASADAVRQRAAADWPTRWPGRCSGARRSTRSPTASGRSPTWWR